MNLAIVVSQFHWEKITSKMLDLSVKTAKDTGANIIQIVKVPGSFDIPLAVKNLLEKNNVDGVITLGAILQGETSHDEVIAYSVAQALTNLSLQFSKPVVLGINGPRMTLQQAIARIPRAADVTKACIEMVSKLKSETE